MKIDTEIIRTLDGKFVWADDNPSGRGFLAHAVNSDVADSWLEKHGLIEPEKKPVPPKKVAEPKKTAAPVNKAVKGPANDK